MSPSHPGYVMPGRATDWNNKDLYTDKLKEELGPSRHLTFIFTSFVLM